MKDKLAFWTEAVSETFVSLGCSALGRDYVEGDINIQTLAALQVARVRGSSQTVTRLNSGISEDSTEDCYLVGIQTRGSCVVTQDGRVAGIKDGAFALYDTTRPYSLELTDDFEQIVVRLPRSTVARHLPEAQRLTAVGIGAQRGAGALLVNTIRSLANDVDTLAPGTAYSIAQGVEHLIAAGLGTAGHSPPATAVGRRRALIQQYILVHLRDPSLDISSISAALHLSSSSIHRAFANCGDTVMNWVWGQRLSAVHRDLAEGRYREGLTELAFSWGFSSSAHFSRAFRGQYGYAPSRLRARPSLLE